MKHFEHNPRQISKVEFGKLKSDLEDLGDLSGITHCLDTDQVLTGNQRAEAMGFLSGKISPVITASYDPPSRTGTVLEGYFEWKGERFNYRAIRGWDHQKRQRANIRANKAGGVWDFAELTNAFEHSDLIGWGFDEEMLKNLNEQVFSIDALLNAEGAGDIDNTYSRRVEAPIYTPKGDKPSIEDLYNTEKTDRLIAEINVADIPEPEKVFLRIAAQRHTVLNFKKIAEYYAHSTVPGQRLFENSALVIIDFQRAIELGFVKLSKDIADQYREDYENDTE